MRVSLLFTRTNQLLAWLVLLLALSACRSAAQGASPTLPAGSEIAVTGEPYPIMAETVTTSEPTATVIPPAPTPTPLPLPTATANASDLSLTADDVQLYPVPDIFAGDRVTFQVRPFVPDGISLQNVQVQIYVDDQLVSDATLEERSKAGRAEGVYEWVWNTQGQTGEHQVRIILDAQDVITEGDDNPANNEVILPVRVRRAGEQPLIERDASWITGETDCCLVHAMTRTAAYRDFPELLQAVELAVREAVSKLDVIPQQKVEVYLIDRTIGQGGYAGADMVIVYIDRSFAGGNLHQLLVHEAVHVIDREIAPQRSKFLAEGVAVWASGGHYKAEDLNRRAAALLALGEYIPLTNLVENFYPAQHEIGYLQAGAFVNYLVERDGWSTFREFYSNATPDDAATDVGVLDANLQLYYEKSLPAMEAEWLSFLESIVPRPEELADLETSIRYYEVMRRYQAVFDPTSHFLAAWLPQPKEVQQKGNIADLLRHPQDDINITLEAMLRSAEKALHAGDHSRSNVILDSVEHIIEGNSFSDPLSASYRDIVRQATAFGYEVQDISLQGGTAQVLATTASGYRLIPLNLQLSSGDWILLSN